MEAKAIGTAAFRAKRERALTLRRKDLSLDQSISIGLRSGRRQIHHRSASGFNRFPHTRNLVCTEIVHHNNVSFPQMGNQMLLHLLRHGLLQVPIVQFFQKAVISPVRWQGFHDIKTAVMNDEPVVLQVIRQIGDL